MAIGTRTDSNGNDPGMENGTTAQIYEADILPSNHSSREIKAKTYYSLRTMSKKFKKCGQVKSIVMHLQNAPIYYGKYKKEENEIISTDGTNK